MVNLELYKVFYEVAKSGSLTKAAERLYISQPAVSQAVKQLEKQLGVTLFNRTHKGMELSPQGGKLIYSKVEQALHLLGEAENQIEQLYLDAQGTIRIGASETIFEYFLADKIVAYNKQYPQVKIELIAENTLRTIEDLKNNRCDVAFVNLPIADDLELKVYGNCMRLTDIFITGGKNKELTDGTIPLARMQDYPLVVLEKNTVARKSLDSFLASVGIDLKPAIEISSWEVMKRLVIRGMGVGVIPKEYVSHRLADHSLYEVKVDPPLPARSVGMAILNKAQISYALRMFIEMFDLDV